MNTEVDIKMELGSWSMELRILRLSHGKMRSSSVAQILLIQA
jgi:hypothetical protein